MKPGILFARRAHTLRGLLLIGTTMALGIGCGGNETVVVAGAGGAGSSVGGASGGTGDCTGAVSCACYANGTCDSGLSCVSNVCVRSGQGGSGSGIGGGANMGGAIATSTGGAVNTTTTGGATGTCASASSPGSPADYYACACNCTFTNTTNSGNWTKRCVSPSDPNCASCSATCSAIAIDNASDSTFGSYISGTNGPGCSLTSVPVQWSCNSNMYGTGDGCDCGCGALDPDCGGSASSTACAYCANSGSCASSCSAISSTNNATCTNVPAGWRCAPAFYGSGDGCDCGCGIKDPDCTSAAASVCQYNRNGGSCIFGCSSINTTNNAVCQ